MAHVKVTRVLAAVDFSDWTVPVLRVAAEMASRYQAGLSVVYAELFLPPPYFTESGMGRMAGALHAQQEAAREHLERTVTGTLGEGAGADARLLDVAPVEGILRTADAVGAGLIVMGTHGRSGINRLLLGSVAERVVREAAVPVLTVRGPGHGGWECRLPFRRILCPHNYTPGAREALRRAADLAQRTGAELLLMTSLEEGGSKEEVLQHQERLCAEMPQDVQAHCTLRSLVRRGPAAEQILRLATEEQPDLIVIGAQHRALLEATVIGTTSVRVMRHASCPVLTVTRHAAPGGAAAAGRELGGPLP